MRQNYLEYLRYGKRVFFKRNAPPLYLIFIITSRCNAFCSHCFNWKRQDDKHAQDLTLDEFRRISAHMDDLPFMFLSGGEAFLRNDFAEIAEVFHRQNRVQKMQTPTNGSLPKRIDEQMGRLLRRCPDLHYSVTLSVDAVGDEHDRLRHIPGLFERVLESHRVLQLLQKRHSNLGVNFEITVSANNQDSLLETYRYLRDVVGADNVFTVLTRGAPRDATSQEVDLERYLALNGEVDRDLLDKEAAGYNGFPFSGVMNAKEILTRDLVYETAKTKRFQIPCYAGNLSGVIFNEGDVYPCEILDEPLGNLRDWDYDFRAIWQAAAAQKARKMIRDTECFCTHECFLTANLLFNPRTLPRVAKKWAKIRMG